MKKLRLSGLLKLAVVMLMSCSVLLLFWLSSPLPQLLAKPETKIFEQVWQTVNENFYDPNFNGVNWKAMREKYQPQVAQTKSKAEFAIAINQMLSELQSSHIRYYTQDEPAYYQLLGIFVPRSTELQKQLKKYFPKGKIEYTDIGIFTKNINNKTFISAILDGSPAAKADLKVGDQIISVDGRSYQPIQSFAGKAGEKVKLLIQRSPDRNSQKEIAIMPKMLDASTMFIEAHRASTQIIQRQGKKIGYIHIWSHAANEDQQQLQEEMIYGRLKDADALVLDFRDGWGGGDVDSLNIFTAKEGPSVTSISRKGRKYTYVSQWKKPVAMVINEGSRSSKEIYAYGFQQHKIGSVIGSKTAGAVVAGRPFFMPDGSLLYVAVADVFVNGNERLEGKGVTPDINVAFPLEYAQGADPQKERAIETVLAALK
ncbi:S41 family peptidase [Chlorogloeopsis sp. ULAP01]|uniref:S41 family peptidase n=1 Tax=Chlorogloeopsis sp. ULAP01 TaxID=3056483 RepID=UPI0025AAED10|nr:S41 family peptidase [Chlorogloeopsis sp. ULAP01]MDM9385038.1 S41 family peptidase [Chlorogloeopsis sp. ULAP01]